MKTNTEAIIKKLCHLLTDYISGKENNMKYMFTVAMELYRTEKITEDEFENFGICIDLATRIRSIMLKEDTMEEYIEAEKMNVSRETFIEGVPSVNWATLDDELHRLYHALAAENIPNSFVDLMIDQVEVYYRLLEGKEYGD